MNIATALSSATNRLREAGIFDPRREAASLLAFVLEKDTAFLVAHPEHELTAAPAERFVALIERRAAHEPLQYITRRQEFWRLEFEVTRDVLIPRPETEILVEAAIEILSTIDAPRFCEVGIGSGCISVSILHSVKSATAMGTDISAAAVALASRNAEKHAVRSRLEIQVSNVFGEIEDRFDLIASNPPYVPDDQMSSLQAEVREFEPQDALSGGADGLAIIRRIAAEAPQRLKPGGCLVMEIGFDQAERVRQLFEPPSWAAIEFLPDLQGIPRIVKARVK